VVVGQAGDGHLGVPGSDGDRLKIGRVGEVIVVRHGRKTLLGDGEVGMVSVVKHLVIYWALAEVGRQCTSFHDSISRNSAEGVLFLAR
jgi:hypothetical protein